MKRLFTLFAMLLMASISLTAQEILTPKAPDTPRINGAKVYGVLGSDLYTLFVFPV